MGKKENKKIEIDQYLQGSLFEEDYLIRTLGGIAHKPDIALTELVANAWDAGASRVNIIIPEKHNEVLTVEDNGMGLTREEFHKRWMKLGYNRLTHQGKYAEVRNGINKQRLAYGRNGVGRHGMLCFNDTYKVITRKNGKETTFHVSTLNENQPFVIVNEKEREVIGNSTKLEVIVNRNLPDSSRVLEAISSRFFHDPEFIIYINGRSVDPESLDGFLKKTEVKINEKISIELSIFDTQKLARSRKYHGIAFWQAGRLVGKPSWILGENSIFDGRSRDARRYIVLAKSNDLGDFVNEDWTGFLDSDEMNKVYEELTLKIRDVFKNIAKEHIDDTKASVKKEFQQQYSNLSPLGRYEVDEVIDHIVDTFPSNNQETLSIAVEAVIKLEKTRNGAELLSRLSKFSEEDIIGLNRLLDQWSIKEALSVLDVIDNRIACIEAIDKLAKDKEVDELKVLHPLLLNSRWLFGPEYESAEYSSNSQLRTIANKIFKLDKVKEVLFENDKVRPDLFVLGDSIGSVTGIEQFDLESKLTVIDRILIIELKRGGSNITRENRDQASHYVEDFIQCSELHNIHQITAFVVGHSISGSVVRTQRVGEKGHLHVTTYSQLVDTARRRLFNLREKLRTRYEDVTGLELVEKLRQMEIEE